MKKFIFWERTLVLKPVLCAVFLLALVTSLPIIAMQDSDDPASFPSVRSIYAVLTEEQRLEVARRIANSDNPSERLESIRALWQGPGASERRQLLHDIVQEIAVTTDTVTFVRQCQAAELLMDSDLRSLWHAENLETRAANRALLYPAVACLANNSERHQELSIAMLWYSELPQQAADRQELITKGWSFGPTSSGELWTNF